MSNYWARMQDLMRALEMLQEQAQQLLRAKETASAQGIDLSAQNQIAQHINASSLPRYVGADYETVDDGSAAHELESAELRPSVTVAYHALSVANARIAALEANNADLATLLGAYRSRVAQLQRDCEYWKGMAVLHSWKKALAEEAAEDTDAFPDNALKHSV